MKPSYEVGVYQMTRLTSELAFDTTIIEQYLVQLLNLPTTGISPAGSRRLHGALLQEMLAFDSAGHYGSNPLTL
jgi:hypothetical protein